jgi:hypothetical protein
MTEAHNHSLVQGNFLYAGSPFLALVGFGVVDKNAAQQTGGTAKKCTRSCQAKSASTKRK